MLGYRVACLGLGGALAGLLLVVTAVSTIAGPQPQVRPGGFIAVRAEAPCGGYYDRDLLVSPGGTIRFPDAGGVAVGGKSAAEAAQAIEAGLAAKGTRCRVTVSLGVALPAAVQKEGSWVSVVGAVLQPQRLRMSRDMMLNEAVYEAGMNQKREVRQVILIRSDLSTFRLDPAIPDGLNARLQPGDVILVQD